MISAGNDVVSLTAIDAARTNQHKFYSKILSDSEIPLYNELSLAGIPFENFVWLLWSIKESAYKFLQRFDAALIFTPVKFVVESLRVPLGNFVNNFNGIVLEDTGFENHVAVTGVVKFEMTALHSCSLLYDDLISTVVNDSNNFQRTCWGFKSIDDPSPENQSKEVRLFLIERLTKVYGDLDLKVEKNENGCPVLLKANDKMNIPVSLSHHESIIGYSFTNS